MRWTREESTSVGRRAEECDGVGSNRWEGREMQWTEEGAIGGLIHAEERDEAGRTREERGGEPTNATGGEGSGGVGRSAEERFEARRMNS